MSNRGRKAPAQAPIPIVGPAPEAHNRFLFLLTAALAAFLLLSLFSAQITDSDFWWHLKTGQFIVQNHRLPVPDPFAYTTATAGEAYPGEQMVRRFNLTHEWLYQALLYSIFSAAGFPGIVLFRATVLTLLCAIAGAIAYRRAQSPYGGLLASLACATVATMYVSDRPFGVSFLMLAAVLAVLELRRHYWLLPILFLVWANLHGGFFIGWAALFAYAAEAAVARWRGKRREDDTRLWIFCGASLAASACNPNVFDAVRVVFLYRQSVLQTRVWEWQRPLLLFLSPFTVIFYAACAALLWANRKVRLADWLLFAAFATGAVLALRNVMLIAILGPILVVTYFPWKVRLPHPARWAIAALLLVAIGYELRQGKSFQLSANTWRYPSGAAKFLEDHGVRGRLFNDYTDGGYLIWRLWPFQRVFIDGRALSDTLYLAFANSVVDNGGPRATDDLLRRYGVEVIVLSGFEYTAGTLYNVVPRMSDPGQSAWNLVYVDDVSSVFMKAPPLGMATVRLPYPMAGIERQCRYHIDHDPTQPLCAKALGYTYIRLNDVARARTWLAYYLDRVANNDPEALATYAELLRRRQ